MMLRTKDADGMTYIKRSMPCHGMRITFGIEAMTYYLIRRSTGELSHKREPTDVQ